MVRNNVYDVLQLLDFPDPAIPTGDRATTTVAPQALLMLNSDLVMQAAEKLAEQLLALPGDDAARIDWLYRLALGRGVRRRRSRQPAGLSRCRRTVAGGNDQRSRAAPRRDLGRTLPCGAGFQRIHLCEVNINPASASPMFTRRDLLRRSAVGFGSLALASLLRQGKRLPTKTTIRWPRRGRIFRRGPSGSSFCS